MKNLIIVFGHTGYVGKNLYMELKKFQKKNNFTLKGISSKQIDLTNKNSILKLNSVIKPNSTLVVCSAIKSNFGTNLKLMKKNIDMIENLAFAIEKKKLKKLIYISSKAVYGVHKKNKLMSENTSICPDTFYSLSKVLSENILNLVFKKKGDIKKLLIFRPSIVYGPGENIIAGSPSGFLKQIIKKEKISLWGDGSEIRDFLYIDDLITVITQGIKNRVFGIFNVGGYKSSYASLIKKIEKISGVKAEISNKKRTTPKIDKKYSNRLLMKKFSNLNFTSINAGIKKIYSKDFQK